MAKEPFLAEAEDLTYAVRRAAIALGHTERYLWDHLVRAGVIVWRAPVQTDPTPIRKLIARALRRRAGALLNDKDLADQLIELAAQYDELTPEVKHARVG